MRCMPKLPRRYGQSQSINCPFCGEVTTSKNTQGLPVCRHHTKDEMNLKCACGDYLDVKDGKFGAYFSCFNCGNVSWGKAMEINDLPLRRLEDI